MIGQSAKALQNYGDLLSSRLRVDRDFGKSGNPLGAGDLFILDRIGDLAVACGQIEVAERVHRAAAELYDQAGNLAGRDYTRLKLAHALFEFSKLSEAQEVLELVAAPFFDLSQLDLSAEGIEQWELCMNWRQADPRDRAELLALFELVGGKVLLALGQYGESLNLLERCRTHCQRGASPVLLAIEGPAALAIAENHVECGRGHEADVIIAACEQATSRKPGLQVNRLEILAKVDILAGRFGAALRNLRQALELCQGAGQNRAALIAGLNLCKVMILVNQTAAAEDILRSILQSAEVYELRDIAKSARLQLAVIVARRTSGLEPDGTGLSVHRLRRKRGHVPNSVPGTQLEASDQSRSFMGFFEDRALELQMAVSNGDADQATVALRQLKEVFGDSESPLIQARIQELSGLVQFSSGNFEAAEESFRFASDEFERLGGIPEQWQANRFLTWCMTRQGVPKELWVSLARETAGLLERMLQGLDGPERALFLLNKWTADEESLALEVGRLVELQDRASSGWFLSRFRRRAAFVRELCGFGRRLESYRALLARRHGHSSDAEPSDHSARISIPSGEADIQFLVLPDRLAIARFGRKLRDIVVLPVTRLELREAVAKWHESAARRIRARDLGEVPAAPPSQHESESQLADLASLLRIPEVFEPIANAVHHVNLHLDDCLHGLPWAAFKMGDARLGARFTLSVRFEFERRPRRSPHIESALVCGVSKSIGDYPALPGVAREVQWLASLLESTKSLQLAVDNDSTSEFVQAQMPKSQWIHMACHGSFEQDRPDESGFVLASESQTPDVLSVAKLSQMDLGGVEGIVLSSCWSADNYVLPGRWIIGFPETLIRSGARTVVGSLWEVDDESSFSLLTRFYENLNRGKSPASALQAAQVHTAADPSTSDPFFWAGFCVYGSNASVRFFH